MLRDIRERLGDDEVGGKLDRIRQSTVHRAVDRHRDRCTSCERFDGYLETFVSEERGMDSPREVAELGDCLLYLVLRAREDLGRCGIAARRLESERDRQGDEPLLRAIVQVALDPAALGVGGRDDSFA